MPETITLPQRPDAIASLTGMLEGGKRPSAVSEPGKGGKFDLTGQPLFWPGNTFICHVAQPSPEHDALSHLQDLIKRSQFARYFTFLPAESFHMTVFQGWSPFLQDDGYWPVGLRRNTSRDETTAELCKRTNGLELPSRFKVRPDGLFALHSLTVRGADQAQEERLRNTRVALRDATKVTTRRFANYIFHITLAYQLSWVEEIVASEIVAFSDELGTAFAKQVPKITLGPCELCNFDTMHHFETVSVLGDQEAVSA